MVSFKFVYPLLWASMSSMRHKTLITTVSLAIISTASSKVHCSSIDEICEDDGRKKLFKNFKFKEFDFEKAQSTVVDFFETGLPTQVGYGFLMGYSSGFCLKKLSKVVAFGIGGAFIFIQVLSANGYINVEYEKIQQKVENVLDLNKDGKLDAGDVEVGYQQVVKLLGHQMPSGGGFVAGIIAGLRA